MPQKPPSVSEIIIMLAKLGGFLNRKNDGFPGMTHIWKGWHKLEEVLAVWRLLKIVLIFVGNSQLFRAVEDVNKYMLQ